MCLWSYTQAEILQRRVTKPRKALVFQGFFFALFKPVTCNLSSCVPVSLELDLEGGPRDRFQTGEAINVWGRFYLR